MITVIALSFGILISSLNVFLLLRIGKYVISIENLLFRHVHETTCNEHNVRDMQSCMSRRISDSFDKYSTYSEEQCEEELVEEQSSSNEECAEEQCEEEQLSLSEEQCEDTYSRSQLEDYYNERLALDTEWLRKRNTMFFAPWAMQYKRALNEFNSRYE